LSLALACSAGAIRFARAAGARSGDRRWLVARVFLIVSFVAVVVAPRVFLLFILPSLSFSSSSFVPFVFVCCLCAGLFSCGNLIHRQHREVERKYVPVPIFYPMHYYLNNNDKR
jgi:hypothetical protein